MSSSKSRFFTYEIKLKNGTKRKVEASRVSYVAYNEYTTLVRLFRGNVEVYCNVLDKIEEIVNTNYEKKSTLGVINGTSGP